jgi:cytoskeletal protein CcmA (bactofilin family)
MFEKPAKPIAGPGTVVGANVKLTGTLRDVNDIIIHGRVDGEIFSEKNVTITETSVIKGPITATSITIGGRVKGSIEAAQKMEILPTGKVYGSIVTKDLSIRSGAILIGKCSMPQGEAVGEPLAEEVKEKEKEIDEKIPVASETEEPAKDELDQLTYELEE